MKHIQKTRKETKMTKRTYAYRTYAFSGGFIVAMKQTGSIEIAEKNFNKLMRDYEGIEGVIITLYDIAKDKAIKEYTITTKEH